MLRRLSLILSTLVLLPLSLIASAQTVLTHHRHQAIHSLQPIGRLPQNQIMTLDVVLPLRDTDGLLAFIKQVNDPGSPVYRHFLTPSDFAVKFGPSEADYNTVINFLAASGFNVYGGTFLGRESRSRPPSPSSSRPSTSP